ncbi:hypothetical protein AOC36_10225 [Erysipelothrix larvae]|uniref:Orotate phosphoribosyltransferase n=1 Tax=Erysipelothrix larvae TaxID=1514105 RepID=A0A0X8H1W8_9FIRM|nr:orotate phosphoribosyltransferase [Erysipelothrix larvae]AMC94334.1 hypothetical protein AOC36_10225 [Erysipelothrix larvae]
MNPSQQLAQQLLSIKAVSLSPNDPYTWASGLKAPIYCDNRVTLAFPNVRTLITKYLVELIKQNFESVDVIAGTATAGIPQAALVAHEMGLPMIYVRSSAKTHGKENKIEGKLNDGEKVVVVEDLISTGGSCIEVCKSINLAGGNVLGVVANFTYELEKGIKNFSDANIPFYTISNYTDLVTTAAQEGYVTHDDIEALTQWKENPEDWSKKRS